MSELGKEEIERGEVDLGRFFKGRLSGRLGEKFWWEEIQAELLGWKTWILSNSISTWGKALLAVLRFNLEG